MRQHLRHYSKTALAWRQQITAWRQQGYEIVENCFPERDLFFFRTDSGWQGGIDLEDWIARALPQCGTLASAAWKEGELEQLFVAKTRSTRFPKSWHTPLSIKAQPTVQTAERFQQPS